MTANPVANPYLARPVMIARIVVENEARDLKTFRLAFVHAADREAFAHRCGQFAMLSVPGVGECPIGIASSPTDAAYVEFTVKRYSTGLVSSALHALEEGDRIGLRGPYGNGFPLAAMEGRNVVIVGGGFAFTTLRATIRYLLHEANRPQFGKITAIYGARSPGELLYKDELKAWQALSAAVQGAPFARPDGLVVGAPRSAAIQDIEMHVTVDKGDKTWAGREGFVPAVVSQVKPGADNAVALVCGPPVMMNFTMKPLMDLGFSPDTIITSLERRMSCGIGKCGRCNVGNKYVCKDGPVFTYRQIQELSQGKF